MSMATSMARRIGEALAATALSFEITPQAKVWNSKRTGLPLLVPALLCTIRLLDCCLFV